ncbi:MAG: HEPN domain-containing protein [Candidatus Atabeyarchaeum deiterrae]
MFLNIATNDLRAAKLLLAGKLYAQSIFYMEQSVEKAVKSLGIRRGDITPKEARRYGHRPLRYYLKFFENIKTQINETQIETEDMEKKHPILADLFVELGISRIGARLNKGKKMYEDLLKLASRFEEEEKQDPVKEERAFNIAISGRPLDRYITWWREQEKQLYRSWRTIGQIESKSYRDELERDIPRFQEILRKLTPRLIAELPSEDKLTTQGLEKAIEGLQKPKTLSQIDRFAFEYAGNKLYDETQEFFFIGSLFYLALLFFPHATRARYPDEGVENPLSFYSARNPLVRRLAQFIEIAEHTLDFMNKWILGNP